MAKGQTYNHERIRRTDPTTGVNVLQLSSFPVTSMHVAYYYTGPVNGFTYDSTALVFLSKRSGDRHAPWDLFRVGVDGANLTQLTEHDSIGGIALSPTQQVAYYYAGGSLRAVDLLTLRDEEIAHEERSAETALSGYLSPDGRTYLVRCVDRTGETVLIRHRTDRTETHVIPIGARIRPHSIDMLGRGLFVSVEQEGRWLFRIMSFEGDLRERYGWNEFAHSCPLGRSGLWQGCAQMPRRAILTLGPDQGNPSLLVEGPYFWHSSASLDGEWIVADTNWPNEGLQLVNVKTRRFRTLLHPHNSAGHPQWTHPHPMFSPDMKYVAYNSDWTGVGQVWIAEMPRELLDELRNV